MKNKYSTKGNSRLFHFVQLHTSTFNTAPLKCTVVRIYVKKCKQVQNNNCYFFSPIVSLVCTFVATLETSVLSVLVKRSMKLLGVWSLCLFNAITPHTFASHFLLIAQY